MDSFFSLLEKVLLQIFFIFLILQDWSAYKMDHNKSAMSNCEWMHQNKFVCKTVKYGQILLVVLAVSLLNSYRNYFSLPLSWEPDIETKLLVLPTSGSFTFK